ncbi:hypothetical protein MLD52_05390 [Puniceicoccaceae bacterium K14]|nr:hypothetical protein [Puniceicoccaceae bacterium K14]
MHLFEKILVVASILLGFTPLYAHRQPEALTTIEYNQGTESTEIVHRLHAHDAEQVLLSLQSEKSSALDTLEGRALVALHVEKCFQIANVENGTVMLIKLLGAELEDDTLYVYQEYDGVLPGDLKLRNDIFREYLPGQVNTVIILSGEKFPPLIFSGNDSWKYTLK